MQKLEEIPKSFGPAVSSNRYINRDFLNENDFTNLLCAILLFI